MKTIWSRWFGGWCGGDGRRRSDDLARKLQSVAIGFPECSTMNGVFQKRRVLPPSQ